MYRKVLFARLDRPTRRSVCASAGGWRDRLFHELVYKLTDHYSLRTIRQQEGLVELEGDIGRVIVVRRPHRDSQAERRWCEWQADPSWRVSIDLYDAGLLLGNPRLHPQHFLLK